jgi:hypothetical protein
MAAGVFAGILGEYRSHATALILHPGPPLLIVLLNVG